uniref:Tudor domain-containing protein n=1 Tax=Romanomermis culicivorax TaxID=13658 RepID=A0A915IJ27_ROMCU
MYEVARSKDWVKIEKGDFYFQPHQHRKYIDFLTFRMQLYYLSLNDDETRLSYDTILSCEDLTDVWCAAPFSCNPSSPDAEHYYRARIVARVTPTNYDVDPGIKFLIIGQVDVGINQTLILLFLIVSFVDYGNRCVVPFSNLKFLPDSFSRLGSFAHCCRLSKSTWVDVCALKEKLATKPFALVRLENLDADPWEGRLFLTDGRTEEDIGVYLASIGAATFAVGAANFAVNDKH